MVQRMAELEIKYTLRRESLRPGDDDFSHRKPD